MKLTVTLDVPVGVVVETELQPLTPSAIVAETNSRSVAVSNAGPVSRRRTRYVPSSSRPPKGSNQPATVLGGRSIGHKRQSDRLCRRCGRPEVHYARNEAALSICRQATAGHIYAARVTADRRYQKARYHRARCRYGQGRRCVRYNILRGYDRHRNTVGRGTGEARIAAVSRDNGVGSGSAERR